MDNLDFIGHIREKKIYDVNEQRSLNRSSVINCNRSNFEEIENRLKHPSINEFRDLCKTYASSKKDRDLFRIRLGLSRGPTFISAFHETESGIYSLVGSLTGGNPKLQMEAIFCLINLGLGDQPQCKKVCLKVGTYLISLGSDNNVLQEYCLWAFGNLCGGHPEVCQMAFKQGLEGAIARSLASNSTAVVQSAAYVLKHYLSSVNNRIRTFCSSDLVRLMMSRCVDDSLPSLSWSLFCVSTQKVLCSTLVDSGGVAFALENLDSVTSSKEGDWVAASTPFVRILTNCVAACNSVAIELCYQADKFVPICCRLLNCPQSFLVKETVQLIANVFQAAAKQPITGEKVLEDSNLKSRLDPPLRTALASSFQFSQDAVINFI